jgi:hypothetical protein
MIYEKKPQQKILWHYSFKKLKMLSDLLDNHPKLEQSNVQPADKDQNNSDTYRFWDEFIF